MHRRRAPVIIRTAPDGGQDVDNKVDVEALSAAIAGFLACHVVTCKFLVQEGVIDRDRFIAYLETAMAELSSGLEDRRALFGLSQLVEALRSPPAAKDLQ
jgi:hypothetical protein